jgi:hypothetical protein
MLHPTAIARPSQEPQYSPASTPWDIGRRPHLVVRRTHGFEQIERVAEGVGKRAACRQLLKHLGAGVAMQQLGALVAVQDPLVVPVGVKHGSPS